MNSGSHFLRLLSTANYPKAHLFKASNFDWLFDDPSISLFIENLCSNITEQNFLSDDELNEYEELQKSGCVILEGTALEEAVQIVKTLVPVDDTTIENEREEIDTKRTELKQIKMHCDTALMQRNTLSSYLGMLNQKQMKLVSVRKEMERRFGGKQNCFLVNSKANKILQDLSKNMFEMQAICKDIKNNPLFPSSLDFDVLNKNEKTFNECLQDFMQKQFFLAVHDSMGSNYTEDYDIFRLLHPELHLVKKRDSEEHKEICREISRLLVVMPSCEKNRIILQSEVQRNDAMKNYLTQQVASLKSNLSNVSSMQSEVAVEVQWRKLSEEYENLIGNELPAVLSDWMQMERSILMMSIYKQKLTRQQYTVAKIDDVMKLLMKQKARRIYLLMILEKDKRNQTNARQLLHDTQAKIKSTMDKFHQRKQNLEQMADELKNVDLNIVAESNLLLLHKILNIETTEKKQSNLSYEELLKVCKYFKDNLEVLSSSVENSRQKLIEKASIHERNLKLCEKMISGKTEKNTASFSMIINSPDELLMQLNETKKDLGYLEQRLTNIMQDYSTKQQELKLQPYLSEERNLFIKFCNEPQDFVKLVNSKISLVKSNTISNKQ